MKDLFIEFLKEQNVFDCVIANFSEEDGIEAYLEELSSEPNYYLTDAFNWGRTEEGYVYWCDINMKWLDLLELKQQNETNN